jgi:RNA polymerase sigma factor (sigma-70 family)
VTYDEYEAVFTLCLREYRPLLRGVGLDEADVRQNLWVRVLTRPLQCDTPAFLRTVARAAVIDILRAHWGRPGRSSRARVALLRAEPLPPAWESDEGGYDREPCTPPVDLPDDVWGHRLRVLNAGLDRLLPEDRRVIEACYTHDRLPREVARELGCTTGRVYQRKERALRVLRESCEY